MSVEVLKKKIQNRTAKIAVIGLGYVGLPLVVEFAKAGFQIYGYDTNLEKIKLLLKGFDPTAQKIDRDLKKLVTSGKIKLFTRAEFLKKAEIIIICVPTPLTRFREPDLWYIKNAVAKIQNNLRRGQFIILESTSYPGTTEEEILPKLEGKNFKVGQDFYLAFSPERIDPGNIKFSLNQIPKVVGGVTKNCTRLGVEVYQTIFEKVYPASSPKVAEMEKLLENIFRSVNIALVNELALLCRKMDLDIWEVIELAATKPYGFMPFYPGPGLGGHCIPVDPFYLTWKARQYDFATKFIELAGEINTQMPYFVVNLVLESLGRQKKSLNGAKILVLGITYKKDIPDTREAPALKIMELLAKNNVQVFYNDPFIPKITVAGKTYRSQGLRNFANFDCVLLVTNHSAYNLKKICRQSLAFVDTRGATRKIKNHKKIIRL